MAVVLEQTSPVNEDVGSNESYEERKQGSSRLLRQSQVEQYEIVLPVISGGEYQEARDYAIETAKRYSARLVLVYVTPRTSIPDGFLEYAKSEGLGDVSWNYYNLLGEQELAPFKKYAEDHGIEWTSQVFVGKLKDVLKAFSGNRKAIVILNPSNGKKGSQFPLLSNGQIEQKILNLSPARASR